MRVTQSTDLMIAATWVRRFMVRVANSIDT